MALHIQDFEGMQYTRQGNQWEQRDYAMFNQQYATSSFQKEHDMYPALIVKPKGDDDVKKAVKWAVKEKRSIAVKSGGHQYCGASSTSGNNIQIDLGDTYKDLALKESSSGKNVYVYAGVSNRLKDFNAYLKGHGLFIPHGQCAYVGVGGHVQTGGYGQLGRSFGLIGDHIRKIRMICHDGEAREFGLDNDPDTFNAILGGSPGNFGIVTHYLIEVYQDKDYTVAPVAPYTQGGPHAIKAVWVYSKTILTALLNEVAAMSKDPNFPRGFDLCVSVLGAGNPLYSMFSELKDNVIFKQVEGLIEGFLKDPDFFERLSGPPSVVVLYAQWCPTSPTDKYDASVDAWFNKFRKYKELSKIPLQFGGILFNELNYKDFPMSKMSGQWVMQREREFDLPYVKRTYVTNSTTLVEDKWVDTIVDRIDRVCSRKYNDISNKKKEDLTDEESALYKNCKLSVQIQHFGGKNSQFAANAKNGTSYSWRDATIIATVDCFHMPTPEAKKLAEDYEAENDKLMSGDKSNFCKEDRRVYWGSYGDWDLSKTWQHYFENKEKYEKIGRVRGRVDPNGTFTANPFAVPAIKIPN